MTIGSGAGEITMNRRKKAINVTLETVNDPKSSILPHIDVLDKDFGQVFCITNGPVVDACKLHALVFDGIFEACELVFSLDFVVLALDIDVVVQPVVLQLVELAVIFEQLDVKLTPGAKVIIFFLDVDPVLKFLDDVWKGF